MRSCAEIPSFLQIFLIFRPVLSRVGRHGADHAPWRLRGEVRRSTDVIGLDLKLLTCDHVDLLLIERLPVGISQFDGVRAGP